jgi:hypothetical protein
MSAERSTYAAAACASRTAQFKALRSSKVLRDLTVPKALLARLALLGQTVRKDRRDPPDRMVRKDQLDLQVLTAHKDRWGPPDLLALLEVRALGQMEQVLSLRTWTLALERRTSRLD